jgi:hypothetical protein
MRMIKIPRLTNEEIVYLDQMRKKIEKAGLKLAKVTRRKTGIVLHLEPIVLSEGHQ